MALVPWVTVELPQVIMPIFHLSLRSALVSLWLLILVVCVALAFLMGGLFEFGVGGEVKRVQRAVDGACEAIERHFVDFEAKYPAAGDEVSERERRSVLAVIADLVLNNYRGVEGGFWTESAGFVAYSFPTHEGDVPKRDVPEAEKDRITAICRAALTGHQPQVRRYDGTSESLILAARPVASQGLVAWTMSRAHVSAAAAYQRLTLSFAALLVFALVSGGGLLWFFQHWSRRVAMLEDTLAQASPGELPVLSQTGQRELDRIVSALNHAHAGLRQARAQSEKLSLDLARSQRHAALGRMAAELVHEIRNPIAAMRLRAENALAKGGGHEAAGLRFILSEVLRLDDLLQRLLAVARLHDLDCRPVPLRPWLEGRATHFGEQASRQSIRLRVDAPEREWSFDEKSMSRVLDNLLLNALQHSPAGGVIDIVATVDDARCSVAVENTGPVIPVEKREAIFEMFSTEREGGTGLGLGIAREIVEAHGGTLQCVDSRRGARFVIQLPCVKS